MSAPRPGRGGGHNERMGLHRASLLSVLAACAVVASPLLTGCSGSSGSSGKDHPGSLTGPARGGRTTATYQAGEQGSAPGGDVMRHTVDLLEERARALGVDGAAFTVHGATITATAPGNRTAELRQIAAVAELTFRPVLDSALPGAAPGGASQPSGSGSVSADLKAAYAALTCAASGATPSATPTAATPLSVPSQATIACDDKLGEKFLLAPAALSGADVDKATSDFDKNGGGWIVDLDFTAAGGRKFADVTGTLAQQVSPANRFAMLLDGSVLSAPSVESAISGGQAQITGNFTQRSARELAALIDSGTLPVTLTVTDVTRR